jgi:hypothetical protein
LAEEFAEDGTGGDVGVAVAVKGEASGTGVLVGGEGGLPCDGRQALGVVGDAPDVDLAGCQGGEPSGWAGPVGLGEHGGILCQLAIRFVRVIARKLREKHFPYGAAGEALGPGYDV